MTPNCIYEKNLMTTCKKKKIMFILQKWQKLNWKRNMGTRFGLWAEKEEKILYCLATLVVLWRNLGTINKNQVNEAERLIKVTAQILKGAIRNYKHETMEITIKGMTTAKNHLISLMTPIYFTNHQKRQLVDFLKKYPCIIYVKSYLKCEFKKFALE